MGKIWIPSSGGDVVDLKEITADATAAADDIADGKTAYANGEKITGNIPIQIGETRGVGNPILSGSTLSVKIPHGIYKENAYEEENPLIVFPEIGQQKTVTPTKSNQTVSADNGKLLNSVTVNPIPDNYIDTSDGNATASTILENSSAYVKGNKVTGTMTNQGAKTAFLNASGSYTIPEGYHNGSGKVTGNSLSSQTDATSGAGDILSGKTAWVNGSKLTGTMANKGAVTGAVNCGGSYTIPAGYHNGSGKVTGNSLASQTRVQSGKTAAGSGQVLIGYEAWVNGGRVTGTMANQGAKTSSLNCGGSYTIPAGYHNGSGKITANSLASQTGVQSGKNAVTANRMVSGYEGWVNGTMPSYGAWPKASGVSWDTTNKYVTLHMAPGAYINETSSNSGFFGAQAGYVDKTVTPTKSAQTVTPDSGKVLHNVTVNAIPNDYLYRDRTTSVTFTSIPIGQSKTFSVSVDSNTTNSITHFILKNSNGNSFIYLPGPSMAEFTFTYLSNTIKIKGDRSTDKTKCNYTFTNVSGPSAIEVRKMYTYRD